MKDAKVYSGKSLRKEVTLTSGVVDVLLKLAGQQRRSLKNYMETILVDHALEKSETNGKIKK